MERRRREQRLKIPQGHGRRSHEHGRLLLSHRHRGPDHLDDAPAFHGQRPPRGQFHPLHQHHGQAGEGLRQQVSRIHEGGEGVFFPPHGQGDGPAAAPLIPPLDQAPNGPDGGRQQAEAVDGDPEGQRPQQHAPGPGAGTAQGDQEQRAAQQERRKQERQEGAPILPSAQHQGRQQQAEDPARRAQEPGPSAQGSEVPRRPQKGRERRPAPPHGRAAQSSRQGDEQPVHGEVVQDEPLQGDPHATSTTSTVMSSRWPRSRAAAMSPSAMRSRGAAALRLSSSSRSLPSRS